MSFRMDSRKYWLQRNNITSAIRDRSLALVFLAPQLSHNVCAEHVPIEQSSMQTSIWPSWTIKYKFFWTEGKRGWHLSCQPKYLHYTWVYKKTTHPELACATFKSWMNRSTRGKHMGPSRDSKPGGISSVSPFTKLLSQQYTLLCGVIM